MRACVCMSVCVCVGGREVLRDSPHVSWGDSVPSLLGEEILSNNVKHLVFASPRTQWRNHGNRSSRSAEGLKLGSNRCNNLLERVLLLRRYRSP